MLTSKRKILTKPKPSVQNLSVACFPRNVINALLDSRVWISKQYPDIDLPHQELLVKDVELYKLPGSKDSASFRDIIALNPEIQYILNTFGDSGKEKEKQSKVVGCLNEGGLRPDVVIITEGIRSGF